MNFSFRRKGSQAPITNPLASFTSASKTTPPPAVPEMKVTVNPRPSVPKHLLPTRPTRRLRKQLEEERKRREEEAKAAAGQEEKRKNKFAELKDGRSTLSSNYDFDSLESFEMKGNFKWLKGRRFHDVKAVRYLLPNDSREMRRLQLQHYVIKWALQKNYHAPVSSLLTKQGAKILDAGCGPGAWVVDMAVEFPTAHVVGIDICEVFPHGLASEDGSTGTSSRGSSLLPTFFPAYYSQPEPEMPPKFNSAVMSQLRPTSTTNHQNGLGPRIVHKNYHAQQDSKSPVNSGQAPSFYNLVEVFQPTNTEWILGNILDGISCPDETYDFVHQRMSLYSYTRRQWMDALTELVRVTKRGGYVQLVELDLNFKQMGQKTKLMSQKMIHAIRARDVEPEVANSLEDILTSAGLVDVQSTFVSIPIGAWGLEIGKLWMENVLETIQSCRPWLTKSLGMRSKEYNKSWQEAADEFDQKNTFSNIVVAWGQKPPEGEIVTGWDRSKFLGHSNSGWNNRNTFTPFQSPGENFPFAAMEEVEGRFSEHVMRDIELNRAKFPKQAGSDTSELESRVTDYSDHGPNFHFEEWKDAEENFAQLEFWTKRMKEKTVNPPTQQSTTVGEGISGSIVTSSEAKKTTSERKKSNVTDTNTKKNGKKSDGKKSSLDIKKTNGSEVKK